MSLQARYKQLGPRETLRARNSVRLAQERKDRRLDTLLARRNISPFLEEPTSKKTTVVKGPAKAPIMDKLQKWKDEKQKKLQQKKASESRPPFNRFTIARHTGASPYLNKENFNFCNHRRTNPASSSVFVFRAGGRKPPVPVSAAPAPAPPARRVLRSRTSNVSAPVAPKSALKAQKKMNNNKPVKTASVAQLKKKVKFDNETPEPGPTASTSEVVGEPSAVVTSPNRIATMVSIQIQEETTPQQPRSSKTAIVTPHPKMSSSQANDSPAEQSPSPKRKSRTSFTSVQIEEPKTPPPVVPVARRLLNTPSPLLDFIAGTPLEFSSRRITRSLVKSFKASLSGAELESPVAGPSFQLMVTPQPKTKQRKSKLSSIKKVIPEEDDVTVKLVESGAEFQINRLKTETSRLLSLATEYERYLTNSSNLPTEIQGEIQTVIGKTKLLTTSKFKQFEDLIDEHISHPDRVQNEDLNGFWEMMYLQVIELDGKYNELKALKENNWEPSVATVKTNKKKKRSRNKKKKSAAVSKIRDAILAQKQKASQNADAVPIEEEATTSSQTPRPRTSTAQTPLAPGSLSRLMSTEKTRRSSLTLLKVGRLSKNIGSPSSSKSKPLRSSIRTPMQDTE